MQRNILSILIIGTVCFIFLPFILFGKNSIITVHDNLDQMIPYFKMFHDNNLFFSLDVPTKGLNEMSTLYYGHVRFDINSLLYYFFTDFFAYTLNYYFSVFLGFFSMYNLLRKLCKFSLILSVFISVCFSILPADPNMVIAVNTVPFIIIAFFNIVFKENKNISWKILFLIFFPVFSSFTMVGIFICAFWFIGTIIISIKNKKINLNLLVGFIVLCVGYILVDLRLFYAMFVVKEPLNRAIFDTKPHDVIAGLKMLLRSFIQYGSDGYYHAASLQRHIVLPIAGIVLLFSFLKMFFLMREATGSMFVRGKKVLVQTDNKIKLLFILEFLVVVFSGIAALYDSGIVDGFVRKYIHLLNGFNWGRVWIFNRVLWYIIFALCLDIISRNRDFTVLFTPSKETVDISALLPKIVVVLVLLAQLYTIANSKIYYNDIRYTWAYAKHKVLAFYGSETHKKILATDDRYITYREFFAEDLFAEIKKDIAYSDEKVVAFGYHPSVLMYNGFNCIDGYNNAYPLSYMQKFRTLIAPELEINEEARNYYDSWGGRMYLYNSELSSEPTRNKIISPVKLNIDMNVFKNDFNGTYILSRAEIINADLLGINLVKRYYKEESIYTIYLYKTK